MRLLFDENTSPRLVQLLADIFPHSTHVRDKGLKSSADQLVWEYARNHDLMIVSKDSDMHQRSFVYGHPPKVIWVRLGNCSTADIERLLRRNVNAIRSFYQDAQASFLSLSR